MFRATRLAARWRALSAQERARLGAMFAGIAALNFGGWGIFALAILPRHFHYAGLGVGLGVALTAWTLGCRHAFDADHIAAIDNTTRKLMTEGQRPLAAGFFFALGHSSLIVLAGVGMVVAAPTTFHAVVTPTSAFETTGGVAGIVLSASFLWMIAAMNLVVLAGIARVMRGMRRGAFSEEDLEAQLQARGLMYRFFGRWMRSVTRTWQMFFVGFAFGIGFDTATEVLLLGGTAAAATQGLPWYAIVALPLLFAGGMTLFDSCDGFFMSTAYGWAFARPVRKIYYNLIVTGLSVAVAFLVGAVEIVGLLSSQLHLQGWLGATLAGIDLNTVGFIVVGLFVTVWVLAVSVWKLGNVEARWERHLQSNSTRVLESPIGVMMSAGWLVVMPNDGALAAVGSRQALAQFHHPTRRSDKEAITDD